MIGSFWNLCRTCPSMPVDKLHSEYRSTYRWHEYTGPRQEVVRRGPQSAPPPPAPAAPTTAPAAARTTSSKLRTAKSAEEDTMDGPRMEPALPRRKKHPELAYRTHEFLALTEDKPVIGGSDDSLETAAKLERARSEERSGPRGRGARRSKSEGPVSHMRLQWPGDEMPLPRRPRVLRSDSDPCEPQPDMVLGGDLGGGGGGGGGNAFSAAMNRISTEYRLQFAWPRGNSTLMGAGAVRMLRPGVAAAVTAVTAAAKVVTSDGPPRKSLSMGAIKPGNTSGGVGFISVHKKRCADCDRGDEGASELEPLVNDSIQQNSSCMVDGEDLHGEEKIQDEHLSKEDKPRRRREYKTEYKKKFRPFSQYDYVEGKFQKKREEMEAVHLPLPLTDIPHGDSWYREVLELRKKAGEYKHRGWGTEFVPQHIADLYSKQMTLWEQVSRRSSLSALSLASTTPRCISKEEKDKENNKKSSPSKVFVAKSDLSRGQDNDKKKGDKSESRSRKEFLVRHHLDRTTGTTVDGALLPSPTREKLEPAVSRHRDNESVNKSPQKSSPKNSPRSARSQSLGPAASYENRSPKRQPRAIDSTKSSSIGITSKSTPGTASNVSAAPIERRPRSNLDFQKKRKSYIHKTDDGSPVPVPVPVPSEDNVVVSENNKIKEEDSPAVHSFADSIHEPVVKSPPEPTRVKSPEQLLMRSPEPVNWTVPLDTGKTFTVTQNVRDGESCVNRPHSEAKAWTPPAIPPPPAPQSAPPQLTDDGNIFKQISEEMQVEQSLPGRIAESSHQSETVNREPSIAVASCPGTRIAGTTLHCLDAPIAEPAGLSPVPSTSSPYRVLEAPDLDIASTSSGKSIASDVLEMARSRFDKLFGKANTSSADEDENV